MADFTAYLLAITDEVQLRSITVPDEEVSNLLAMPGEGDWTPVHYLLDELFRLGQNEFQSRPVRSLSVGDVVDLKEHGLWRVRGIGWEKLPEGTEIDSLERGIAASLLR